MASLGIPSCPGREGGGGSVPRRDTCTHREKAAAMGRICSPVCPLTLPPSGIPRQFLHPWLWLQCSVGGDSDTAPASRQLTVPWGGFTLHPQVGRGWEGLEGGSSPRVPGAWARGIHSVPGPAVQGFRRGFQERKPVPLGGRGRHWGATDGVRAGRGVVQVALLY